MADCIKLKYDGKVYELTFTRETVRQIEGQGFNIQAFVNGSQPATQNPLLFRGSFYARNKKVKNKLIDEIYDHLDNKSDLLVALADLYSTTLETIIDTAAENDGKNVTWETV